MREEVREKVKGREGESESKKEDGRKRRGKHEEKMCEWEQTKGKKMDIAEVKRERERMRNDRETRNVISYIKILKNLSHPLAKTPGSLVVAAIAKSPRLTFIFILLLNIISITKRIVKGKGEGSRRMEWNSLFRSPGCEWLFEGRIQPPSPLFPNLLLLSGVGWQSRCCEKGVKGRWALNRREQDRGGGKGRGVGRGKCGGGGRERKWSPLAGHSCSSTSPCRLFSLLFSFYINEY